jgi:hypothetical protein
MDRVRGGVFSGAMVLAGISATLIAALIAIGMRQVTNPATRPTPIFVQPASGEVAVPDAHASSAAPRAASASSAANDYVPVRAAARHSSRPASATRPSSTRPSSTRQGGGATTGSVTSGGSVAPASNNAGQQPATASGSSASPSPSATPTPSPSASAPGNGNGDGNANGNGNGNGNGHHH